MALREWIQNRTPRHHLRSFLPRNCLDAKKNLLSCRCSLEPSQWWFQLWICVWHSWRVCLWVHFKDGSFWICLRVPVRDTCIHSAVIGHILALLSSSGSGKKYVPQTWMSYTANSSIKVYCPNILISIKKQMAAKIGKNRLQNIITFLIYFPDFPGLRKSVQPPRGPCCMLWKTLGGELGTPGPQSVHEYIV